MKLRQLTAIPKQKLLLLATTVFFLIAIPLTVYLAITQQFIFKRAAIGQTVVNLAPTLVNNKNVGETFTVEVHLTNLPQNPISAATITLDYSTADFTLTQIVPESPFTLVNPGTPPTMPFTVVARIPTNQLPTTTDIKLATITFQGFADSQKTISVNTDRTEIVRSNGTSTDVVVQEDQGTSVSYVPAQSLCRIDQCSALPASSIQLTHELRPDNKYNIRVVWQTAAGASFYKVYRNAGAALPDHSETYRVATTNIASVVDSNFGVGYTGGSEVHYDIDTYIVCP